LRRRRLPLALAVTALVVLAVPAVAIAEYGAIAVSKRTGHHGASVAPTLSSAQGEALQACGRHCVVIAAAQNECSAVVHVHRQFWAGYGATRSAAVRSARQQASDPHAGVTTLVCPGPGDRPLDYASIALNRRTDHADGGFGPTKRIAETVAKANCGRHCRVMLWVENECGALVAVHRHYSVGFGPTRASAVQAARQRAGDPRARVLQWICI